MKTAAGMLSASSARIQFMKLVRDALDGKRCVIHHRDGGNVILISEKDFRGFNAAQRLMKDLDRQRSIEKARDQIARGEGITYEQWRKEVGISI